MQPPEAVAGHGGVHVMLDVVVHPPVQEVGDGIQPDGPDAQAEIRHVVTQANVHRHADEIPQPVRHEDAEGDQQRRAARDLK